MTVCAPCILSKWMVVAAQRIAFKADWKRSYDPSTERLCWYCSELLSFRESFDHGDVYFTSDGSRDTQSSAEEWLYHPPAKFGGYSAIKSRAKDCAFCDVVMQTLDVYLPQQGLQADGSQKSWENKLILYARDHAVHVYAPLKIRNNQYDRRSKSSLSFRVFYSLRGEPDMNRSLENRPAQIESLEHSAYIVSSKINLDFARKAYRKCLRRHNTCRAGGYKALLTNPPYMRLIDVQSLRLVMAPAKCSYVTLSYVWGNVNSTPLADPDASDIDLREYLSHFPRTIRDSIDVVRAMGLQYLWVDDICIQDTTAVSRVSQFGDMHRIYGNAEFTIVAAQGSNAEEGLYGIKEGSRSAFEGQTSSPINERITLVRELTRPSAIEKSNWMTRGWCLQEQLLSKAFLVFWDNQVYWQCSEIVCFEDISGDSKLLSIKDNKSISSMERHYPYLREPTTNEVIDACRVPQLSLVQQILDPNAGAGLMDRNTVIRANGSTLVVRPAVFDEYTKVASQYSQRILTKEIDALRAIDGVLTVLSNGFQAEMLHGLPESFLDAALLWRAAKSLSRRCINTIPSWSWAGWEGEVVYSDTLRVLTVKSKWNREHSTRKIVRTRSAEARSDSTLVEHFERLRPWAQWYTSFSAETASAQRIPPRPINTEGMGIRGENELRPNDWTRRERVEGFPTKAYMKWVPGASDAMTLQLYTLRTSAFRIGKDFHLDVNEARSTIKRSLYAYEEREMENEKEKNTAWEVLGAEGHVVGHLTHDSWADLERHSGEESSLIVLSEAQLFDDLQLNIDFGLLDAKEDEFSLLNVMLVDLDATTMVARRKGIGKVVKGAFHEFDDLQWGGVSLR